MVILGKIQGSHHVGRSQDLALDIKEGLARFKGVENFPARIILFDGLSDFEEAKQQIISFDWMANLPFLHFPRVESFERDFVMRAIAIAGGGEVAKSLGFEINHPKILVSKKNLDKTTEFEKETFIPDHEKNIEEVIENEEAEEETPELKGEIETEKPNFIKNRSVFIQEPQIQEEELSAKEFGFIEDEDIKEKPPFEFKSSSAASVNKDYYKEEFLEKKEKLQENYQSRNFFSFLSGSTKLLGFLSKKKILIFLLPIFGFFALAYFAYINILKAEIFLYFEPKTLDKEMKILLDTKSSSLNIEKGIIPAEEQVVNIKGQAKIETSGEKLVGEKAKGKVIIYNKTSTETILDKGTVLIGGDNLKFILNDKVKIASSSSQETAEGQEIIWGKSEAEITAVSIGEESNLKAGSSLSFKDYSTSVLTAKSEEGLKGGTSEKIKIVTSEDRQKLLDKLTEELKEKAKDQLKQQISDNKIILDKIAGSEVIKKEYDKKVDDEADELNLNLELSLLGLSFKKEDLIKLLGEKIKDELTKGFEINLSGFETEVIETKETDSKLQVDIIVKAKLNPKLLTEDIQRNLAGQNIEKAKEYLFTLPNLKKARIEIYPSFLGSLKTLPQKSQNIKIQIKEE